MVIVAGAENLVTLFVGFELLSIPLYILCAAEVRKAPSLESGLKYLVVGSVGSATLLYGLALIYGATGSTDFSAMADAIGDTVGARRPAAAHRRRARHRRPRVQGVGRALPPVDARRLPGRPHPGHQLHGRGDQGRRVRHRPALLRPGAAEPPDRVGARAGRAGHGHDPGRQRRRDRAELAEADAGLVGRGAGRATCWPAWWWAPRSGCRPPPSTWPPTCS